MAGRIPYLIPYDLVQEAARATANNLFVLCSTIIPTVGRASLERAVRSALEQEIAPERHEIIVVNDSGKPLEAAGWMAAPQVRVVTTNRCERSVACNVGAALATGKYLKFLHDDDYLLPGGLPALLEVAERSGCGWVYGAYNMVDNEDRFLSLDRPPIRGNLFAHLVAGEILHVSTSLVRREAFFRAGGFDPLLSMAEDADLESRIALWECFDRTDAIVAGLRVGQEGSTSNWAKARQALRHVREKMLGAPGALPRLRDAVAGDLFLRGRVCRSCLYSAVLNLKDGRLSVGFSRLFAVLRLAAFSLFSPRFWRGLSHPWLWPRGKDL